MNRFFKLLFIFLFMALSFCVESADFQTKEFKPVASIESIASETVELASNNIYRGEIYTTQDKDNSNSLANSQQVISLNSNKNLFTKNTTHINGSFIHNLSTNLKETKQIRAP